MDHTGTRENERHLGCHSFNSVNLNSVSLKLLEIALSELQHDAPATPDDLSRNRSFF